MDGFNLRAQVVRHGAAILFVRRINLVTKGRPLGVKHTNRIVSWNVLSEALHHVDHAADSAGSRAARVARHSP